MAVHVVQWVVRTLCGPRDAMAATATAPCTAPCRTSTSIKTLTPCPSTINPSYPLLAPPPALACWSPIRHPPLVPPLAPLWSAAVPPSACPHLQVAALHRHTHHAAGQLSLQRQHAGGLHDSAHTSQAAMQHRASQRLAVRSCNVWPQAGGAAGEETAGEEGQQVRRGSRPGGPAGQGSGEVADQHQIAHEPSGCLGATTGRQRQRAICVHGRTRHLRSECKHHLVHAAFPTSQRKLYMDHDGHMICTHPAITLSGL